MSSATTPFLDSSPAVEPLILQVEEEEDGERNRNFGSEPDQGFGIGRGDTARDRRGRAERGDRGGDRAEREWEINAAAGAEPAVGTAVRTVYLDGTDIRELDVLGLRRKVGMLFQLPFSLRKTGGELSVGQAQRVALAGPLLMNQRPNIDTKHRGCYSEAEEKPRNDIVMVSHSIKQIQRIADRVCLLVDGEIMKS
ncbi:ABC transporter I family member 17 [Vitis vinifera]|uniref:ABC transporter I family member 17 n=1 Tax=Vitis vinifera TaxID=29760 RepID=A0A438CZ65_VITVI|nr:ABC transporter I family member 17 [Vitis vinifera]